MHKALAPAHSRVPKTNHHYRMLILFNGRRLKVTVRAKKRNNIKVKIYYISHPSIICRNFLKTENHYNEYFRFGKWDVGWLAGWAGWCVVRI